MKQKNIIRLILPIFIGLLTINAVSAGFNVVVTPVNNVVQPGGIATFNVEVVAIDTLGIEEIVDLSVTTDSEGLIPTSWQTTFTPDLFPIGPYSDVSMRTRTSTLQIVAPDPFTSPVQLYVKGDGLVELVPGDPDSTISAELSIFPIAVAPVPELNTIILTSAGLLGLVLVSRRKKGT